MVGMEKWTVTVLLLLVYSLNSLAAASDTFTFVPVEDINNSTFFIRKLEAKKHYIESCYEARRKLGGKGFTFCYPAVSMNGFGGCATAELQQFLSTQQFIATTSDTEHCPNIRKTIFDYFQSFAGLNSSAEKVHLNMCAWPSGAQTHIAQILAPRTANIFVVCNQPDRAWNLYNMYCDPLYDKDCEFYTTSRMYRSPMMFDQYLRMQQYELAQKSATNPVLHVPLVPSCAAFEKMYSHHTLALARVMDRRSLVLAGESLRRSNTLFSAQIRKIQKYLNDALGTSWTLDESKYPQDPAPTRSGQGDASLVPPALVAAPDTDNDNDAGFALSPDGLYEVSQFRPMLPRTVELIMGCWKECPHISHVTGYHYNCTGQQVPHRPPPVHTLRSAPNTAALRASAKERG
jgi:hypothetical protein